MPDRTPSNIIARRPLLMYFVFSYAFFWLMLIGFFVVVAGLLRVDMTTLPAWLVPLLTIIGSWMPSLAAAIVTGVTEGRGGVRALFARFFQFRLAGRWYLAALIPLPLAFAAAGIYRALGGAPAESAGLTTTFWVSLFVLNFLTGPTGEEPGWRGFALPRLLKQQTPLKAGLILGVVWSFWHLPLWLTNGFGPKELLLYVLFFNVGIISLTLLMTWIYRHTSGSLVPMTIIHFTYNAAAQLISQGLGLGPVLPLFGWMAGLTLAVAVIVWGAGGLSGRAARQLRSERAGL